MTGPTVTMFSILYQSNHACFILNLYTMYVSINCILVCLSSCFSIMYFCVRWKIKKKIKKNLLKGEISLTLSSVYVPSVRDRCKATYLNIILQSLFEKSNET